MPNEPGPFTLLPLSIGELFGAGVTLSSLDETLPTPPIRELRDIGDLSRFQRLVRVCAGQVGEVVHGIMTWRHLRARSPRRRAGARADW